MRLRRRQLTRSLYYLVFFSVPCNIHFCAYADQNNTTQQADKKNAPSCSIREISAYKEVYSVGACSGKAHSFYNEVSITYSAVLPSTPSRASSYSTTSYNTAKQPQGLLISSLKEKHTSINKSQEDNTKILSKNHTPPVEHQPWEQPEKDSFTNHPDRGLADKLNSNPFNEPLKLSQVSSRLYDNHESLETEQVEQEPLEMFTHEPEPQESDNGAPSSPADHHNLEAKTTASEPASETEPDPNAPGTTKEANKPNKKDRLIRVLQ